MTQTIKSYKGFNSDLTCRNFQYEIGKEYEIDGEISLCNRGFHACQNPFDVLEYYDNILNNRYCEVEQSGKTKSDDNKTVSSKIKIKAEIGFHGLFKAGIEWLKEVTNPTKKNTRKDLSDKSGDSAQIGSSGDFAKIGSSGNSAQIGSSGNFAQIGSSGDSAKIGSSGDSAKIGSSGDSAKIGSSGDSAKIGSSGDSAQIGSSGDSAKIGSSGNFAQIGSSGDSAQIGSSGNFAQIDSSGEDCVICCAGHNSCVTAKQGSWITLAEWWYSIEKQRYIPKCVKTEYVDGDRIKADTWYKLINGKFTEK